MEPSHSQPKESGEEIEMSKYYSQPMIACYDEAGEAAAVEAAAAEAVAAAEVAAAAEAAEAAEAAAARASTKTFTQAEVNAYLAADRRKTEAKHKAQTKAELEKQEKTYNALLVNQNLTEQERDGLRESLTEVEKQLHSREELLTREKKELEAALIGKVTDAEKRATDWESKFKDSSIERELQEAAVKYEAYNVRQMMSALRPYTKLDEEAHVMVDLEDVVDGKSVVTTLTPEDAMKRMKELPEMYGNFFKANVVSGVGGNSNTDGLSGANVDPRSMTQAQYQEYRKTKLGLGGN